MIYLHVYLYIYITVIIAIYVTWNSCNMGTSGLPGMYAQSRGPQAQGHTYQANHECP